MSAQHGPNVNYPQPAHKISVGLPLRPYSCPCDQATRSLFLGATQTLFGRGGSLNPVLSQESCGKPGGCWAWGYSLPGPHTGPRNFIALKPSPYHLFFQCPLNFLVSCFHKCWDTVDCSLCSSVYQLGVSPLCRGRWTPLPPISLPSSPLRNKIYLSAKSIKTHMYIKNYRTEVPPGLQKP